MDAGGGITCGPAPDNEATRIAPIEVPDPTDGGGGTACVPPLGCKLARPTPPALIEGAGDTTPVPADNDEERLRPAELPAPLTEGAGGTTDKSTRELTRPLPGIPEPIAGAGGITTVGRSKLAERLWGMPFRSSTVIPGEGATT